MPKREMLINYVPGEECRIAIIEDGRLDEFYQERASTESHVGNIYKARVTNVEPAIQAAFLDFGLGRNGFLHITDVHPMYFPGGDKDELEKIGQKTPRRNRPLIQECFKRGNEVLVQVLKEGIGTKGPTLTTYLSIPGRYLVMMHNMERMGVSRKIEDEDERKRIRKILDELEGEENFGFIVRTAGIGRTKAELKRDLSYLTRLWKAIDRRRKQLPDVGELYTESDLIIRTIRDVYSSDIERVIVDHEGAAKRARDFLAIASPRASSSVYLYKDPIPLYHRFEVEEQIEHISARTVPLKSGGSLVIDQTEAVVAIDVNSGRMRDSKDAESTAYRTNVEAVDEICRQLRLRDMGGVVINDLIDMRDAKHRRKIEQRFRDNLKDDRARTRVLPISQFGIVEMTRQRMRPSLRASIAHDCPSCQGRGTVKSGESVVLDVMRRLAVTLHHNKVQTVELTVSPDVAFVLLNRKRSSLVALEHRFGKQVMVRVHDRGAIDHMSVVARDTRGGMVDTTHIKPPDKHSLQQVEKGDSEGGGLVADSEEESHPDEQFLASLLEEQEDQSTSLFEDDETPYEIDENDTEQDQDSGDGKRKRRRRGGRRNRGRGSDGDNRDQQDKGGDQRSKSDDNKKSSQDKSDQQDNDSGDDSEEGGGKRRRRRRRRRGGRGRNKNKDNNQQNDQDNQQSSDDDNQSQDDSNRDKAGQSDKQSDDNEGDSDQKSSRRRKSGDNKSTYSNKILNKTAEDLEREKQADGKPDSDDSDDSESDGKQSGDDKSSEGKAGDDQQDDSANEGKKTRPRSRRASRSKAAKEVSDDKADDAKGQDETQDDTSSKAKSDDSGSEDQGDDDSKPKRGKRGGRSRTKRASSDKDAKSDSGDKPKRSSKKADADKEAEASDDGDKKSSSRKPSSKPGKKPVSPAAAAASVPAGVAKIPSRRPQRGRPRPRSTPKDVKPTEAPNPSEVEPRVSTEDD